VTTEVTCPICGGEAMEDFNCNTYYTSYFCNECGYTSNSDVAENPKEISKHVPKAFRRFIKWGEFEEGCGAAFIGCMPWWPGGMIMAGQFSVTPIVARGKLLWRRREIEEIPEKEQKNYPMEGGGYYKYKASEIFADYEGFAQAISATKEDVCALWLARRNQPRMKLLGGEKTN